jgi:alkylation response protein AidB-like acyl-CoA dehydrogenase
MIDFNLSEEEALIQRTARAFADEQLRPRGRAHEQHGIAPELARAYLTLAFSAVDVPERLGGQGLGLFAKSLVLEELARGDAGAVLALDGAGPALSFVLELPGDAARPLLVPFLAEPGHRGVLFTDWERTLSIADGHISGTIPWVPSTHADLLVVCQGGKAHVITERVQAYALHARGLRAAGSSELVLASAPIAGVVEDAPGVTRAVARTRCYAAALLVGIARAALEYAVRYTQDRVVFGKPIAHHQAPAFLLADMRTGIEAARGGRDGALDEAGSALWPGPRSSTQPHDAAPT